MTRQRTILENQIPIRVLCYGDSNTHGRDPKRKAEEGIKTRFPVE